MPNYNTDIPQYYVAKYEVDVGLKYLEEWLAQYGTIEGETLEMNPDFQRAHVWDDAKRIKYVEYIMRGGTSSRHIYWNHPGHMGSFKGAMQLVDGKQRIEAVRRFMRDDLPIFGHTREHWDGPIRIGYGLHMCIGSLQTRAEVLQWYLDLNDGGVVHTANELNKVRAMLAAEGPPV